MASPSATSRTPGPSVSLRGMDPLKAEVSAPVSVNSTISPTGSEVEVGVAAAERLSAQGKGVRVVSMPSTDVFLAQDADYRDRVLPPQVRARVAVEAGVTAYWRSFVGATGKVIGVDRFGASAPASDLYEYYGVTSDKVIEAVRSQLNPN